ncbi:MAG: hypothetical protein LBD92_05795 [Oscillospiraceae bacterium]|nr:hypothetical protein [Oscillospiraceae bacterium]
MTVGNALKSRKTAAVALVLSMLVFTPAGVRVSFAREAAKVEKMFYDGIPGRQYTKPPIDAQLDTYSNAMLGYATVAAKYPDLAEAANTVLAVRRDLLGAETVMEKYRAYIALVSAVGDLHEIIISDGRSQSDYDAWNDYGSTGHGAGEFIKKVAGDYNGEVDKLLDMADEFPIRYMGGGLARPSLTELRFGAYGGESPV